MVRARLNAALLISIMLLMSCGHDTTSAGRDTPGTDSESSARDDRASQPQGSGEDSPSAPGRDSSVTADANFLLTPSEPPEGLAEVLAFGEGGGDSCDSDSEPLSRITAMPGFLPAETAETGWTSLLCLGGYEVPAGGVTGVEIVSPSGEVVSRNGRPDPGNERGEQFNLPNLDSSENSGSVSVDMGSGRIALEPAIGDELGPYMLSIEVGGERFEREVEVARAKRESGVLLRDGGQTLRDPAELIFQVAGFQPDSEVLVGVYRNDAPTMNTGPLDEFRFFNEIALPTDEFGQAELRVPMGSEPDVCWAFIAEPPAAADLEPNSEGLGVVSFLLPHFDHFCPEADPN